METDDYVVTLEALQELARPFGVSISREWISKRVRNGLLPPQQSPGLGPGKGRRNLYSVALARQLVPLLQALAKHGKNLGAVGWELWWYGWPVDDRYWREPLLRQAKLFDEVRTRLTPISEDDDRPSELLRNVGDRLHSTRTKSGVIGTAKRHSNSGATDLISIVMSVFMGSYLPFKEYAHSIDDYEQKESQSLLAKSLTVPVSDADIPNDNLHLPISVEALDGMFSTISGQFDIDVSDFIRQLPEREIIEAHNQIVLIMIVIGTLEAQGLANKKKSIGGKAIFWAHKDQKQQLAYLVGWLVLSRMLGFEGMAASIYYQAWHDLPLKWAGLWKKPVPASWSKVGARSMAWQRESKNARHPINALLNYGYAILISKVRTEIVTAGFDPTIGFAHRREGNRIPLVYDLMEPLRPVVDRQLLEFALAHTFTPEDFTINSKGGCRLNPQMAKAVARQILGLECGPIVQGFLQASH